jgi:cytidine deaminase
MKKQSITFDFEVFEDITLLPIAEKIVLEEAISARSQAYAPYSNFYVGAAVQLENGEIVRGANQENAAYPSGLCAERVAMFHAGAQFPDIPFQILAISATSKSGTPIHTPVGSCGSCRQVIHEYRQRFQKPFVILLYGNGGLVYRILEPLDLLPLSFDSILLDKK